MNIILILVGCKRKSQFSQWNGESCKLALPAAILLIALLGIQVSPFVNWRISRFSPPTRLLIRFCFVSSFFLYQKMKLKSIFIFIASLFFGFHLVGNGICWLWLIADLMAFENASHETGSLSTYSITASSSCSLLDQLERSLPYNWWSIKHYIFSMSYKFNVNSKKSA